ncbi:uncharacterized protein STEHIDRAFT_101981 [Stereum hirsutum FP-91666 SS1]|uniref:uncharacterized protein n=1 Tax=Stereum hirsutum (strain FP-91666) TaxID=721885 RepID=UPI0004449238|nr:uncharacterized protein STEHIDRAFT_101981 [Stereum hirsutum FP-91666 SS1]EIM82626.1 hypothetical protein STEHIDRAFT_101981 [Stereum hirsutum FP-91666 SS1]
MLLLIRPGILCSLPHRPVSVFSLRRAAYSTRKPNPNSLPPFDPEPYPLTQRPNPSWKLGDGLKNDTELTKKWKEDEEHGWKSWNLEKLGPLDAYKMLTSAIVPRPIAFVSTLSRDGVPNLAPFSYFSMVSHNPPLLSISFALSPRRPKDTRENILATKQFVVNIISEPFVEAANATCVESPAEHDEWEVAGLEKEESVYVKPSRVKESAISFECELHSYHDFLPSTSSSTSTTPSPSTPSPTPLQPQPSTTLLLGLIKHVHIRNSVLSPDGLQVDPEKLRAVSRLGGVSYAAVGRRWEVGRVKWPLEKN